MGCGCGGSGIGGSMADGSAPLLTGVLSGQYADLPGGVASSSAGSGVVASDINGDLSSAISGSFSSGGFWVVVLFMVGAAWYLDRKKKDSE